ncbi:MAG TPA: SH3 domain-containing protein [Fontimonas sp.]
MARIEVVQAYRAQYDDPIAFQAGEPVDVEREDAEFRGWYWCRDARGRQGWVHLSFLSAPQGRALARRDYSARELTVDAGTVAELLDHLDGWLRVRLDDGAEGWLPESHVKRTRTG